MQFDRRVTEPGQGALAFRHLPYNRRVSGSCLHADLKKLQVIEGYMVENPAMRVGVKLSRRAEIP